MEHLLKSIRRPDITFCRDGRILISATVASALGLQPGDGINIYAYNGEYYIYGVSNDGNYRYQSKVFRTKRGSSNFRASSVRLARRFLDACGIIAPRAAFAVGSPICLFGRTYIPIITKHPLSND